MYMEHTGDIDDYESMIYVLHCIANVYYSMVYEVYYIQWEIVINSLKYQFKQNASLLILMV